MGSRITGSGEPFVFVDYVTHRGDTFWKVAQRYDVDARELLELNREGLRDPNVLPVGYTLRVPVRLRDLPASAVAALQALAPADPGVGTGGTRPTRPVALRMGELDHNERVQRLVIATLHELGYDIAPDAPWDAEARELLLLFQASEQLTPRDGRIGLVTLSRLSSAVSARRREAVEHQPIVRPTEGGVLPDLLVQGTALPDLLVSTPGVALQASWEGAADVPLTDNDPVHRRMRALSHADHADFAQQLQRASRYAPIMRPILARYGVPLDSIFVAMVESGFRADAHSPVGAVGFWQFMPETGRAYGLRIDDWVDERRDFEISTDAAGRYLRDIHAGIVERRGARGEATTLADWELAWAGYNSGHQRIWSLLERSRSVDPSFWSLRSQLPAETRAYVPGIIAATTIAKDPAAHGFGDVQAGAPLRWETITVADSVSLAALARHLGVETAVLRELNPAYVRGITPPRESGVIRVPEGLASAAQAAIAELARPVHRTRPRRGGDVVVVQAGDTFGALMSSRGIARNDWETIRQRNGLDEAFTLQVGQELRLR